MSQVELKMPKMGESVAEATITKWLKKEGDRVEQDEPILEIATDKVDSEVPSTAAGILVKQLYNEGDVVAVGKSIAIIGDSASATVPTSSVPKAEEVKIAAAPVIATQAATVATTVSASSKFYSPLVRNIAQQENVSSAELDAITGTGAEGRVTKKDILQFIENRKSGNGQITQTTQAPTVQPATTPQAKAPAATPMTDGDVEIIEMDRMRKLIADHTFLCLSRLASTRAVSSTASMASPVVFLPVFLRHMPVLHSSNIRSTLRLSAPSSSVQFLRFSGSTFHRHAFICQKQAAWASHSHWQWSRL